MKILLDECVTKRIKPHLPQHEVATVAEKSWSGIKNGELIAAASEAGFDILLTIDKNLQYQQNISKYALIVIILNSPSSKPEVIVEYLPTFE